MDKLKLQNQSARKRIFEKIRHNGEDFNGKLPQTKGQSDGKFALNYGGDWTDGFYIGVFNLAYSLTGDEEFHKIAEKYEAFLDMRIKNTPEVNEANRFLKLDHDVGMIFLPTAGFNYTCYQREKDKEILIKAADVLKERFNEKGNFIRAWDTWKWDTDEAFIEEKKGKVIVDSMMNIPLLFQVSKITGEQQYYDIAKRHAVTVADYIVREDFSTYHTYNFDHLTGKPLCGKTRQGYSDESCWSRGQAWAVYGFALAYKYTGETRFLHIADKTAKYFMDHLSAMDMPCWDFTAADQLFAPWDSAASAICASGLLEMWQLTGENVYKENAIRLLKALETFCLTDQYPKCQMLLLHGCVGSAYQEAVPQKLDNSAIGVSLVYADYFYLECMLKLSGSKLHIF